MSLAVAAAIAGATPKAGGFSPLDISGLQLWLDASDESTITESGGAVSQWDDKSGNSRHATQGTAANQPATGTATINGRNAIRFDGSNDILQATPALGALSEMTWFIVAQLRSTPATGRAMVAASNGAYASGNQWALLRTNGGQFNARVNESGSNREVDGGAEDTSVHVLELRFIANTGIFIVVDGTQAANTDLPEASVNFTAEVDIGAADNAGSIVLPADVDIGEIALYDSSLATEDRLAVRQYLATGWGVTLA